MNLTKQDALTIPPQFLPISVAGRGNQGNVYFCLPKSSIPKSRSFSKATFTNLKKQVVAVKIPFLNDLDVMEAAVSEIAMLQILSPSIPAEFRGQFAELLDSSVEFKPGKGLCTWMAVRALHPVITLAALKNVMEDVEFGSDALAAHFFLQVGSALNYLHTNVLIAHTDIHDRNILLDTQSPSPNGFPTFVIVDFGLAVGVDEELAQMIDTDALRHETCDLIHTGSEEQRRWEEDSEWMEFTNALYWGAEEASSEDETSSEEEEEASSEDNVLEQLLARFAGLLKKVVEQTTEEEAKKLRSVVDIAVQKAKRSLFDEDFRAALESM